MPPVVGYGYFQESPVDYLIPDQNIGSNHNFISAQKPYPVVMCILIPNIGEYTTPFL